MIKITFIIIIGITIISLRNKKFFIKFNPKEINIIIRPLISIIEIVSYFLRIFTLSFRLSTNILSWSFNSYYSI